MNRTVRNGVHFILVACAASALCSPEAFAQGSQTSGAQNLNQDTTTQLGKVVVTGTRILRTSVETAQPVTIVTAKQIQESGLTTIGDVLRNLTQSSGSSSVELNNGNGQNSINLRNFGDNRVLVLVNGRRWTPELDGSVDLNNIPTAVVDHIEILQDGASAIYGSDAITGVVNIITIKNFNGAQASAYMGMYDNNYGGVSGWDGKTQKYSFTIGSQGNRAGVVMSASYTEQNAVRASERIQSREAIWTQGGGSSSNASGRFLVQQSSSNGQIGSAACTPLKGDPVNATCNMTLNTTPSEDPEISNFRNYNASDAYNYAPYNYFQTPLETESIYMQGHFDLSDNITFTSLGEFNSRSSQTHAASTPVTFGESGSKFNGNTFGIGANNPYNPFHKDLVASGSQYCPDGTTMGGVVVPGGCAPNLLLVSLSRRLIESGPRVSDTDVNSYTFRMGLNGFFNALGSEWDWDLGSSYGKISEDDDSNSINNGQVVTALDAPGLTQCNGPGQATKPSGENIEAGGLYYPILIPGCVPLNLFGGYNQQSEQGSITPAMLNYIGYEAHNKSGMSMRDYTANITGNVAELPAGPVAVALGAEYLENDGFDQPDALSILGGNDVIPLQGHTWSDAEYVEFNIPLLSDLPAVKSLSMDIANRWSQFKWTGGNETSTDFGVTHRAHASTARAQLRWQPSTDLLLRASWAQGFRTPSLNELYTGLSGSSNNFLHDPCAPTSQYGGWDPGTPLPSGCNGITHLQLNSEIPVEVGGNPALQPETAISRSVGFVYNPAWLSGFDMSADYFKIDVGNIVGSSGGQYILNQCYVSQNPAFCAKIETVGSGSIITEIVDNNTNIGEEYERGVDLSAHYRLPATAVGKFTVGTTWTFVQSFVTVAPNATTPTGWQSFEGRGYALSNRSEIPQRKGNVSLNWNFGKWSASWLIQYIGPVFEQCTSKTIKLNECSEPNAVYTYAQLNTLGKNKLGTTIYNDVQGTYHVDSMNTDLTFGIRNLFNKQYPAALTGSINTFIPTAGYRIPGRFFYAHVGVKF